MRAWEIGKHGGPEVLKLVKRAKPEPGPGQALIKVESVGLNHLDLWVRKGVPGHVFPLPLVPGCDSSGRIEDFGALNSEEEDLLARADLSKGKAVVINPLTTCDICSACQRGEQTLCPEFGLIGETRDGACSEFLVVPVRNLIRRPESLSPAQAACLPIAFLTAWTMVVRRLKVEPGEWVLIQAGGSGVGSAAIQFAKLSGAKVITTVGSDEKAARTREIGADHVINYRKSPVRKAVREILSSEGLKGVDAVVEHVGGETFEESLKCLKWGGRLCTCGATSDSAVKLDLKPVFFKSLRIIGSTMGSKGDLHRIVRLAADGAIRPVVDSTYSFDRLPEAMERLESRKAFGKVVVNC